MDPTGGDKRMNTGPFRVLDGLPSSFYVPLIASRQPTDHWHIPVFIDAISHLFCDSLDRLEVVLGSCREPGFYYVDSELDELAGDVKLLLGREGGARGLLAVTESGVEDANVVGVGNVARDVLWAAALAVERA